MWVPTVSLSQTKSTAQKNAASGSLFLSINADVSLGVFGHINQIQSKRQSTVRTARDEPELFSMQTKQRKLLTIERTQVKTSIHEELINYSPSCV